MNTKVIVKLAHIAFWLFLSTGETYGSVDDVYCLKSVKDSVQDPFGYLNSTWDFSNGTEGFICKFPGIGCWNAEENRVLFIELSDMSLKGKFPKGFRNCSSITGLNISSNQLSGTLPSDICQMLPFLTSLDLSSNNFTGKIPLGLSDCKFLNVLKLDNNRLTGQIPRGFGRLERLKTFSVANNSLSGQIPLFPNGPFPRESYSNNKGLCGEPLELCKAYKGKSHTAIMIGSGVVAGILTTLIGACIFPEKPKKKKNTTETNALRA